MNSPVSSRAPAKLPSPALRDVAATRNASRPDYASGSARPASWRRSRSRAAQRRGR